MNSTLNLALKQVSRNLSVDSRLVELVYKSYWKFFKEHISDIDLRNMSMEDFGSVNTNLNIPYLGKLYVSDKRMNNYQHRKKNYENARIKESEANRLSSVSD